MPRSLLGHDDHPASLSLVVPVRAFALFCSPNSAPQITRQSDLADVVNPKVVVSVGNQMDLSVCDFLEHFLDAHDQPQYAGIDVFGVYIEGAHRHLAALCCLPSPPLPSPSSALR